MVVLKPLEGEHKSELFYDIEPNSYYSTNVLFIKSEYGDMPEKQKAIIPRNRNKIIRH
jgi:hypothetical protein